MAADARSPRRVRGAASSAWCSRGLSGERLRDGARRWVVVDTETTGLDPARHHLREVATVILNDEMVPVSEASWCAEDGDDVLAALMTRLAGCSQSLWLSPITCSSILASLLLTFERGVRGLRIHSAGCARRLWVGARRWESWRIVWVWWQRHPTLRLVMRGRWLGVLERSGVEPWGVDCRTFQASPWCPPLPRPATMFATTTLGWLCWQRWTTGCLWVRSRVTGERSCTGCWVLRRFVAVISPPAWSRSSQSESQPRFGSDPAPSGGGGTRSRTPVGARVGGCSLCLGRSVRLTRAPPRHFVSSARLAETREH